VEDYGIHSSIREKEDCYGVITRFVDALSGLNGSLIDASYCYLRYVDADLKSSLVHTIITVLREINSEGKFSVRAVIHVADVRAKVVGTDKYMVLDVYENQEYGTSELFNDARNKGVNLMITEYAARLVGLNRYHFRKVGIFNTGKSGTESLEYEVLDACNQMDARTRWDSIKIFEDGLHQLYLGNVEYARRAMVKVLMEDGNDSVARYYLKQCDKMMNNE